MGNENEPQQPLPPSPGVQQEYPQGHETIEHSDGETDQDDADFNHM